MFKNHFRLVWRNLLKDRQFTFLNLAGLATGLACSLMIWLWIKDELGMDKYNEHDGQLYQVMQNMGHDQGIETIEHTPGLLANALAAEMPEVAYAATVVPASWFSSKGIVAVGDGDKRIKARGQFISKDYFKLFSCRFVEGDKDKLLTDKRFIAISDELAMKLFNTTKGITGKMVTWSQNEFNGPYVINGVFEKNAPNTSDRFDLLFNFELFVEKRPGMLSWGNSDPNTYVLLKEGTDVDRFNTRIRDFIESKEKKPSKRTLFARKFSDKYLYGQYTNGVQSGGRIAYVKLFAVIAVFILLIACINFMNLSTARASRRVKEVGIKKVVGAGRATLILQYLGESVFMSFLSLLLALVLMVVLLPAFNTLTGKELDLHFTSEVMFSILSITLVTGLVAGCYPALYVSGFRPVAVLKGKLKTSVGELWVRKGLVAGQFALSVMAIVAVLVISRQISYIQSRDLGYSRDNVIDFAIPLDEDSASLSNAISFVHELKGIPGVLSASSYYHNLTGDHGSIGDFQWPGKDPANSIDFANLEVGYGFLETMGVQIREGRNFSNDERAFKEIIFNEDAIRKMGLKDPVGKTIRFWGRERQIVGVARDFNFESLYQSIKPCFFQVYPVMPNVIVKIKAGTEKQTIARIQQVFTTFNKGLAFDYRFLDEEYQALYAAENRVAILSKYFTGLAILISCLGLFGLAAFTAQRRQKEIGIRKVVGASVSNIVLMLSKDFVQLIIIAALVAFPLVWWTMDQWLQGFAYRVRMGPFVFLVAGGSMILITLLTIGFQAVKAALENPVKSLRTE